ncbi:hypothetical protein OQY15_09400 [Pedobacter sp. MC2016-15]|nr:hypothetical protein [Pedobacter sp. MC2016-15]MCX2479304.1 hypothetical protein [Pedobacter sp. MC2016-15]
MPGSYEARTFLVLGSVWVLKVFAEISLQPYLRLTSDIPQAYPSLTF